MCSYMIQRFLVFLFKLHLQHFAKWSMEGGGESGGNWWELGGQVLGTNPCLQCFQASYLEWRQLESIIYYAIDLAS